MNKATKLALFVILLSPAVQAGAADPSLNVSASFEKRDWIAVDDMFTLTLTRRVQPGEGRLAVLVGSTDWTDLLARSGLRLVFTPGPLALPIGKTELSAHLVAPDGQWYELVRFPLEIKRRPTLVRKTTARPTLDLTFKAQLAEGHEPEDNAPPRETFQDLSSQFALQTEHVRDDLVTKTHVKVVGATHQRAALRFGQEADEAPKIDLAGYSLEVSKSRFQFRVGDLAYGHNKHLVQNFASRGASLRLGWGTHADLTLAAVNGSKIVGWDNFFGLDTREHRMVAGTLGVELDPGRPGGVRLEASVLDGSLLPRANFNQGLINDAEESRGFGLRLIASDPNGRLRVDGSFARSTFTNPNDPLLDQGLPTVAVEETTRNARYANVNLDVVQGLPVGEDKDFTLTLNYLHERIDPLFRSVAVKLNGDQMVHTFGATAGLSDIVAQFSYSRSEDNLDEIASILKTLTRRSVLDVSLPSGSLRSSAAEPSAWWPFLTYNFTRVHQFGGDIPINSGFSASHVPDQLSLAHNADVLWQGEKVSLNYNFTYSSQDNRQPGREGADFNNRTHSLILGLLQQDRLDLALDLGLERSESLAAEQIEHLRRVGFNLNWRSSGGFGLTALISTTKSDDEAGTTEERSTEADIQASWRFQFRTQHKKPVATLFVRYSKQRTRALERLFGIDEDRSAWQLSTGLNLSAF